MAGVHDSPFAKPSQADLHSQMLTFFFWATPNANYQCLILGAR